MKICMRYNRLTPETFVRKVVDKIEVHIYFHYPFPVFEVTEQKGSLCCHLLTVGLVFPLFVCSLRCS
jgi:hypothetical protein